ncbi:zinc-ribbon domain-containing protein [Paracoccus suum]|uniref:zinc-ribbon domain-containing protein n=1 Tax=Paracoccus suum TaxID=2259340 RepID=UPI0018F03B65|nr:zinc-ribbon domain-containing protein [Paracoccus suum]
MRLTCPDCGAEYEIDEALIPAAGREVECAACGHHWHQPGRGHQPFVLGDPVLSPEVASATEARSVTEAPAPPPPPRPSASVLDILREEAARELAQRGETLPDERAREWTRAGAERPGAIVEEEDLEVAEDDWIGADDGIRRGGGGRDRPGSGAASNTRGPRDCTAQGVRPATEPAAPEVIVAELIDDDELPPPRPSLPLPDASAWAASLQWSPAAVAVPVPAAAREDRSAYNAGFAVAAGLSALLLVGYIAAPHVADAGRPGAAIMELRRSADRGRLALYDRAAPLVDGAVATVAHWLR